ncbi:MAG: ABC transporter permease [Bacillales bacterium]|nr:ABC transporter permease [Bacillales bacterium]
MNDNTSNVNNFNKFEDIQKEKFDFANKGEKLSDQKLDTKPISYFKDAFIRFSKNKASVAAAVIIALIVVYAFLVPLCTSSTKAALLDPYYSKKAPRIVALKEDLGIFDGGINIKYNERALIIELAKGVGAEFDSDDEDNIISLGESMDSYYQPVSSYEYYGVNAGNEDVYQSRTDAYLSQGFMYIQIEQSEYQNILDWQEETGLTILYPLIANNEYNPDTSNANYWYKMNSKLTPVSVDENDHVTKLSYSEDLVLQDNYMRNSEGQLVYYTYIGGGTTETAQYKVRILYYNYYIYNNGFEPEYLLGTDSSGYDLAYRMARGIQLSLLLAVSVSLINFVIGAVYGAIEGYYGGATDLILERVSDILGGIPFIVVATLFQMHLAAKVGGVVSLLFAFVLTGWLGTAYRVRTQFYRFKNEEYVMAARTLGARDRRIIWKHIFPNSLGTIITSSVLVIPGVIFSESMLSYLGIIKLGGSKITSLGTLLSDASSIWTTYPHLMVAPAVVISLLMICFNLFGNGLRDAFNPTLRGVEE